MIDKYRLYCIKYFNHTRQKTMTRPSSQSEAELTRYLTAAYQALETGFGALGDTPDPAKRRFLVAAAGIIGRTKIVKPAGVEEASKIRAMQILERLGAIMTDPLVV